MKYTETNGLHLSKFTLGTVQLGLAYGIANSAGKPDREYAFKILNQASKLGVNGLDTAAAYGDSEEVIGAWLKTRGAAEPPLITTKIAQLDFSSKKALLASVKEKTAQSKKRLGLDRLPGLLLHSAADFKNDREGVLAALNEVKECGDVERVGISLYAEDDYAAVAASELDVVQIPLNIFDWRLIESGKLKLLKDAGKLVFVRSVFLQGLMFKKPETLSENMAFCAPALERYHVFCENYGLSPAALAVSFVLSLPGVASLVLGCETCEQVKSNAGLINKAVTLTPEQMEELRQAFKDADPRMLNPRMWEQDPYGTRSIIPL